MFILYLLDAFVYRCIIGLLLVKNLILFYLGENFFHYLRSNLISLVRYNILPLILLYILSNLFINVFPKGITLYTKDKNPTKDCRFSKIILVLYNVWSTKVIACYNFLGKNLASIAMIFNSISKKSKIVSILSFLACMLKQKSK